MKKSMSWSVDSVPSMCITLERRPDRWRRFQDQSGINGLDLKKFNGVDGKTLDIKNDERISLYTKRNILSKSRRSHEELDSAGGVGCALSHIAIWQWMVDNNKEVCIIFEDDAIIPPNFTERVNKCINESALLKDPTKWDLWLLGGNWDKLTQIPGESKVARVEAFYSFYAYVMTLHGAKRLLRDVFPIEGHIDLWTSIYNYVHDFRIICSLNLNLKHNSKVKTEIQTEKECDICNVSAGYSKTHKLVTNMEWNVARTAEIVSVGLIGYILYKRFISK
jgi:glycosyl transferase family 25